MANFFSKSLSEILSNFFSKFKGKEAKSEQKKNIKEEDLFREIIETTPELGSLQKYYLNSRLVAQIVYMDKKSNSCKKEYLKSQKISIIGGVIVTALVGLSTFVDDGTIKINNIDIDVRQFFGVTAFVVSQVVTVTSALEQLHKNNELWLFYRRTNEYMKSQLWHFLEETGPYEHLDRKTAFKVLVKQLEEIIPRDLDILSTSSNKNNNSQAPSIENQGSLASQEIDKPK